MTTIIRSDVKLSAPKAGTMILPDLGISGVLHRYHAETVLAKPGDLVTRIEDSVGSGHLDTVGGAVRMAQSAKGKRYLDFSAGNTTNVIGGSFTQNYTAYTLVALYYWEQIPAAATNAIGTTVQGGTNMGMNLLSGDKFGVGTWTPGTGTVSIAKSINTTAGWHTIMVAYDKAGDEMAAIDGQINRGDGKGVPLESLTGFALRGPAGVNARIVEASYVNHVLTDAEVATVHSRLVAQIPS